MELPYDPAIALLNLARETLNTDLKEYMYSYAYCSAIYNSQDFEASQMPISRWVDKTSMLPLHNEILLAIKKEENFTIHSMDGPGEHYAKWNKPARERQMPYDFTHM